MNILCIDDEPLALRLMVSMLRDKPEVTELRSFDNASDALSCAEYTVFDLAFVDIMLGGANGLDFAERLRHFGYAAKNVLVSQPITDPKSQHRYSFVFDFSVQTTPPRREALLLCQMSIRRWIPDSIRKEHAPYLRERINAVYDLYRQLGIVTLLDFSKVPAMAKTPCIHAIPKDPQYTHSFTESRIDHPQQRFAEKDMIELYPLQLQSGDNADEWIFYANALRHIPIQYNQSTVLPLPLHLAKGLEEYLFDA